MASSKRRVLVMRVFFGELVEWLYQFVGQGGNKSFPIYQLVFAQNPSPYFLLTT